MNDATIARIMGIITNLQKRVYALEAELREQTKGRPAHD